MAIKSLQFTGFFLKFYLTLCAADVARTKKRVTAQSISQNIYIAA